jgi:tetratricopeptide (TPR) repeat protein
MVQRKGLLVIIALALIAGPLAAWLVPAANAQGFARIQGTITDVKGMPYPDVTLVITNNETNKVFTAKTDAKGFYNVAGLPGGAYNIDLKAMDKVIFQTGLKITGGTTPVFDIPLQKLLAGNAEAEAKQAAAEKAFQDLKTHYDAGLAAITAMKAAQDQLKTTPKDQQGPVQDKITQAGTTATTELSQALSLMKEDDSNRSIVLSRLGEAYDSMGKWQDAADTYQKSIAMKPDVAANYNNLGNDYAKLGKVDEARAAYQKYVDLNPTDAALAWRNFGIVLYQANRMKESIEPLQKATTLDPKNAQAWLLLGIALVNTMTFNTDPTTKKMTPVMQPGTIEAYQKAIDLDPNGPVGAQAKDGLASLQAMGVGGIDTKVGSAPAAKAPAKKK